MPDALKLLTTRRSFKAVELGEPGPSAAEIDTLLTVASRVPDHGKLTPWRFIVFEGQARHAAGAAIAAAFRKKYPDAKPEHVEALRNALTEISGGGNVDLAIKVDPAIIGGLVVQLGSRMVDSSLKTKLNSIRTRMKEAG